MVKKLKVLFTGVFNHPGKSDLWSGGSWVKLRRAEGKPELPVSNLVQNPIGICNNINN